MKDLEYLLGMCQPVYTFVCLTSYVLCHTSAISRIIIYLATCPVLYKVVFFQRLIKAIEMTSGIFQNSTHKISSHGNTSTHFMTWFNTLRLYNCKYQRH